MLFSDKHILHPVPRKPMPDSLVVGGLRNAYDWVVAMWRTCYCCDAMSKGRSLRDFLHGPFTSSSFGLEGCTWADVVRVPDMCDNVQHV